MRCVNTSSHTILMANGPSGWLRHSSKVLDVLHHQKKYWDIVEEFRRNLAARQSFRSRVEELIKALKRPIQSVQKRSPDEIDIRLLAI